jgi:hypothetical protein
MNAFAPDKGPQQTGRTQEGFSSSRVGDVVDVTVEDRQLILRSAEDASRRELLEKIGREVFAQREDAYQRLA